MHAMRRFSQDDHGAVTVDWVVMTAAAIVLALGTISQISGGMLDAAEGLVDTVANAGYDGSSYFASHFYDIGINAFPDNQTEAWRAAREAVADAAPTGYNYDPGFNGTRYVDTATGYPIYESNDGSTYSIGGEIISAADYDRSGRTTFLNAFNENWVNTQ